MKNIAKYVLIMGLMVIGGIIFYKKVYLPKITYERVLGSFGSMEKEVFGIGNVDAKSIYLISSQMGGKITSILTDEGKWVKKGDLLITIDPIDLPALIEESKIGVKKASLEVVASKQELKSLKAQKNLIKITYNRYKKLEKQAFITKAEVDKLTADLSVINAKINSLIAKTETASIEIKRAKERVKGLEIKYSRYKIYSPIDGYIISKEAEVAQSLIPSKTILKIVNPKDVWIKAYIDEKLSGEIKVGQKATIVLRSNAQKEYQGIVRRIAMQTDAVTLEKEVDVSFENLPIPFYMNEQSEVTIIIHKFLNVLKIPAKSVAFLDSKKGVWSEKNKQAHFIPIEVLASNKTEVAVTGLDEKTEILINSDKKRPFKEGMRIAQ